MAGEATDITIRAKYRDHGVQKGFGGLLRKVMMLGMTVGMVTASLAVLTAAVGIGLGAQVEKNLTTVATVAGATREELAGITAEARRIGATTAFTAAQASEGMISLARAGLRAEQIISATADSMKLAGATAGEMGTATRAVAVALSQFGLSADQSRRIVDSFAYSTSRSLLDLASLSEAMKYAGTVASNLGMDLEDAVTAVSAFANIGLEGTLAGMAFKMGMNQLALGTNKVRDALKRAGTTFEEINPTAHSFLEIIERLAKANLGYAESVQIFGGRAGPAFLKVINAVKEGTINLEEFRQGIMDAQKGTGLAAQMYGRMMDNVSGDWMILKSVIQEAQLTIFDSYKAKLRGMLQSTTEFVRDGTEKYASFAKNTVAIMATMKNGIVMAFSDWDFLTGLLAGLWMEFAFFTGRVVNSITYLLLNVLNMVGGFAKIVWTPIGTMFVFLIDKLQYQARGWINDFLGLIEDALNKIPGLKITLPRLEIPAVAPTMKEYWQASYKAMKDEWDKIKSYNEDTIAVITGTWQGSGEYIKKALRPAVVNLAAVNDAIDQIVDKTPVKGILGPDEPGTIADVVNTLDKLIERAGTITTLEGLVGKGIFDKGLENDILREKKDIITEIRAELKKLVNMPAGDEKNSALAKLGSAMEGLQKKSNKTFATVWKEAEGFGAKMKLLSGRLAKETLDETISKADMIYGSFKLMMEKFSNSFGSFFSDLVADSKMALTNFGANMIGVIGEIASYWGKFFFSPGWDCYSLAILARARQWWLA